jgi:uncharacterized phage protein (TIGR01671 family)
MREIKFRAWHSTRKCWLHKTEDACNILGECILLGAWCRVPLTELKDVVVEQYTGLKDKNGKEIFEGDMLYLGGGVKSEIVFQDGGFGYYTSNRVEARCFISFAGHNWLKEILERFEILGNIHENPKLLK